MWTIALAIQHHLTKRVPTCLGNIYLITFRELWTVSACVLYLHPVETKSRPELYRILLTIWSTYVTEQHDAIGTFWQPLNCCSHQLHIFSCFYIHVLSLFSCFKCPISIPNCLIFIWSVFASGTELLHGIMLLKICCFQNTPVQKFTMFSGQNYNGY